MNHATLELPAQATLADLLHHLGDVPPERIRWQPRPGTATEQDALAAQELRRCELVDGTLVDKAMGYFESRLGGILFLLIEQYVKQHKVGFALPGDALIGVLADQLRLPDVSYYDWSHFPGRVLPKGQILKMAPDWAIEILSPGNCGREMERKRREYFEGGTRLVWEVDPQEASITVFTAPDAGKAHGECEVVSAAPVLPGFQVSLRQLLDEAGERAV